MRRSITLKFLIASILIATGAGSTYAAMIVAGNLYNVSPGTAVSAQFTVTNSAGAAVSDIEGMTFTAQIESGIATAPKITAVDLLTGTIWNGHVSAGSVLTPTGGSQLQYQSRDLLTDLPGDFVNANGLLATLMIDTTGALPGDYTIRLVGTKTAGRDTTFLDGLGNTIAATFNAGKLTIAVPEPAGFCLTLLGGVALFLVKIVSRSRQFRSLPE